MKVTVNPTGSVLLEVPGHEVLLYPVERRALTAALLWNEFERLAQTVTAGGLDVPCPECEALPQRLCRYVAFGYTQPKPHASRIAASVIAALGDPS